MFNDEIDITGRHDKVTTAILDEIRSLRRSNKRLEASVKQNLAQILGAYLDDTILLKRVVAELVPGAAGLMEKERASYENAEANQHQPAYVSTREDVQASPETIDDIPQTPLYGPSSDDEGNDPGPPGKPSFSIGHTNQASKLLSWPMIAELVAPGLKNIKLKDRYLMVTEQRRGLLRLFGRGEGLDLANGYDKEMYDQGNDSGPSTSEADDGASDHYSPSDFDRFSDRWGYITFNNSPPANVEIYRTTEGHPGGLNEHGLLQLDPETVWRLVNSYMDNINIMHPILTKGRLHSIVRGFLKAAPERFTNTALIGPVSRLFAVAGTPIEVTGSPGMKRKRSLGLGERPEAVNDFGNRQGIPRSISTALVLLVLALGKICEHKGKLPDVVHRDVPLGGSLSMRNGHSPSPLHTSPPSSTPILALPSPAEGEPRHLPSRRTLFDGQSPFSTNRDVVPGLAYFATATDIIGNQLGGNSLQHVHVNILAALYHGQLARVLESHAYIHEACRALQHILRP
jgi:hypothetical protein